MLLIKNAQVVSPAEHLKGCFDIRISEDGKIQKISPATADVTPEQSHADQIIDATGKLLFPGFIDLHVHLREPGFSDKETIATGTAACAKGGFTTVVCMPNTKPALHSVEVLDDLHRLIERDAVIDVLPCGAITKEIRGEELAPHDELVRAGAVALSDDGRTTMNNDYMLEAYESSKRLGVPVMTHSEDHNITDKLGGASSPAEAEDNIVVRDIELLPTGAHLHVCHVSTAGAIRAIAEGKKHGKHVTGEATPHHIGLDLTMVNPLDPMSKVNPPIRTPEDRKAVIEALRNGDLDCISTDHAPHEAETKQREFNKCTMGISGAETAFAVAHTELVLNEGFSYERLVELMSERPAELLGLKDRGRIKEGSLADLVIVDPDEEMIVDSATFVSKGKNTPFQGRKYRGVVQYTIKRGKVVYAHR